MDYTQILFIVLGALMIITGITGLANKTRKGRRWANLLGETGAKIFYTVLGIIFIVVSFFI